MCDYSLHSVKNRLAVEGEQLFVHKFHTGSKGLAAVAEFDAARPRGLMRLMCWLLLINTERPAHLPAVCVPPGARLRLSGIPKALRTRLDVGASEDVTFTQLTDEPFRYRDAVRFDNGELACLQRFDEGVRVEVLALEIEEGPVEITSKMIAVPVGAGERR